MATVNQGLAIFFVSQEAKITPASPQPDASIGGTPAVEHGWYGGISPERLIGTYDGSLDFSAWLFSSSLSGVPAAVPVRPIYYIMQALDSVTGVRFDWSVPNTPDWAGTGYPGPNAPTDIAIAGTS